MSNLEERRMELTNGLTITRILNGMWQVSGAHGSINANAAIDSMMLHAENGFLTWDLADHYGPAEDFVKLFRSRLKKESKEEMLSESRFFTKWVPRPQKMTKKIVKKTVDVSRKRMGMDALDMIQFHWWDYQDDNYLKAMDYLNELREEGIIAHLGITNFDSDHLEQFLERGIPIVSNQVQYSMIDRRPELKMSEICAKYDVKLLAYGTLCGGLLSDKYLNQPEPRGNELNTASLQKYKRMIDRWGNWDLFQELLNVLRGIANKYGVDIANVAVRYVLDHDFVGGAIIGVRLGLSDHFLQNRRTFGFSLVKEDLARINSVLEKSNDLLAIIGDCGDEYR